MTQTQATVNELIALLDDAVEKQSTQGCCYAIKEALEHVVRSGKEFVDPRFLQPAEGRYARRLFHRDPDGRYSVLIMVWDKGQGTSLHDHAGMWCVECVYRGRISVVSYSKDSEEGDLFEFTRETEIFAGPGEAGALIPPYEYHTIANAGDTPATTIHVYGGDMTWCDIFEPEGGKYRLHRRELSFTD